VATPSNIQKHFPRDEFLELVRMPVEGVTTEVGFSEVRDGSLGVTIEWSHVDGPVARSTVIVFPDVWHWTNLDVQPDWRRRGVNALLHSDELKALARKTGAGKWTMRPLDARARSTFKKRGWVGGDVMELELQ
jgi:GNAT superfamily N-acetyltransferase